MRIEINGKEYDTHKVDVDRHYYVDMICDFCGKPYAVRSTRIKEGKGNYCSRSCSNKARHLGKEKKYVGKSNAHVTLDKSKNSYYVYWTDEITGNRHTTSYARWWWEMNRGVIPDGYRASYKDGNSMNIDPENICLLSPEEFGHSIGKKLMGHGFLTSTLEKMSCAKKGKLLSDEHKKKISISLYKRWDDGEFDTIHKGEHNLNWKGGILELYPPEFNVELRRRILERDKRRCRICYGRGKNTKLSIHHIDGNKQNSSEENLITLCSSCHSKIHHPNSKETDPVIMAFQSQLN